MPIKIYTQSSHLKIIYDDVSHEDTKLSEAILTTKFSAKDSSMSRNPLVKRKILSDIKSFYNKEHNILPVGFLPFLEYYYEENKIDYEIYEMRKFPAPNKDFLRELLKDEITFNNEMPRDYQKEAVIEIIKNRGGICKLPTGTGKSLIMALLLHAYKKHNALILFNTIDLIEQTYKKLLEYGFEANDIGVIQGTNKIEDRRITLLSVQSYENAFNIFPRIKVIIADEVHSTGRINSSEKIIYSCQNASVKIGLSATPWSDNDYETMRLYGNIGPIVYNKEINEQIDANYLSQVEVHMHKYNARPVQISGNWADAYDVKRITSQTQKEKFIAEGYEIYTDDEKEYARKMISRGDEYTHFVNNKERNEKIVKILETYSQLGKRILLIFNRIEHGELLQSMFPKAILIHGQDDIQSRGVAEKKLRDEPGAVVLASRIWSTGKDIEQIDVFINATGGHSSVQVVQKLGRVIRKSRTTDKDIAIAIDFDDSALSPIGINQTKKRYNVYSKKLKLPIKYIQ